MYEYADGILGDYLGAMDRGTTLVVLLVIGLRCFFFLRGAVAVAAVRAPPELDLATTRVTVCGCVVAEGDDATDPRCQSGLRSDHASFVTCVIPLPSTPIV